MRAASRLGINSLWGRRSRTALLTAAVALATALVAALACATDSLNAGMNFRVAESVGAADVRVRHVTKARFDEGVLETVRAFPGVALAVPRTTEPLRLRATREGQPIVATIEATDPALAAVIAPIVPDTGRAVQRDGEIVLDETTSETLDLGIGDEVLVGDGERMAPLRIVGIEAKKSIEILDKPAARATITDVRAASGRTGTLHEVLVTVEDGADPRLVSEALGAALPESVMARTSERVTSGISEMQNANKVTLLLTSILAYIASGFIVLTGMTTSVLERQRELAILRCLGASRWQLAGAQFGVGAALGGMGAIAGIPLGVLLGWIVTVLFPDRLPAGLVVSASGLGTAALGAIVSGLLGAAWPAWNASRAQPISAMRRHASGVTHRAVLITALLGLAGVGVHALIVTSTDDPLHLFWRYATVGVPAMFVGYFLLGVPLTVGLSRVLAPALGAALRLPKGLLGGSVAAAPFRNGFTSGALMVGLALMVNIWTAGSALVNQWLGAIRFPDAFVNGVVVGIDEEMRTNIEALDFVGEGNTCAITVVKVGANNAFGLPGFREIKTNFIAFEVERFFRMTELEWVRGDPETAIPKLADGTGVLVAQEFLEYRDGFDVGSVFPIEHRGERREFEVVGAVSSPGLDIVNKYFDFEEEFAENSIHAVFGSRGVLREFFKTDDINLLQVDITSEIPDAEATRRIKEAIDRPGVIVGSGREIQAQIGEIGMGSLRVASFIAIGAMLIGCVGVANIVIAGIDARRFEFGVLRAVGAGPGVLSRLIVGEVLLVALNACILGTAMGTQAAWGGLRLAQVIMKIRGVDLVPPALPIVVGWSSLLGLTLLFTLPIVVKLSKRRARELLFSTRG
ncbi:MAG: FtsX-like permease family protein [Phycisphaerales bacterium]